MNGRSIAIAVISVLIGLVAGFLLANGINRSEINTLKLQGSNTAANGQAAPKSLDTMTLDPEEIKAKIAEADASPTNFDFQKNLGSALYRYGTMKKDAALIEESTRILKRANELNPKDYGVIVDLGNGLFDLGFFKKDPASIRLSRDFYEKALAQKPDDADVRADYALAYFLDEPPELSKAVIEFQKALKSNPKQERALQYLAQTYIRQGDFANAQKTVDLLKGVNPQNDALPLLGTQIEKREAQPVQ